MVLLEGLRAGRIPTTHGAENAVGVFAAFDLHGTALRIQPSIGIALYPDHGMHESALLSRADEAMYVAKRGGGNQSFCTQATWANAMAPRR